MQGGGSGLTAAKDGIMPTIGKWVCQKSSYMLIAGNIGRLGTARLDLHPVHGDGDRIWPKGVSLHVCPRMSRLTSLVEVAHRRNGRLPSSPRPEGQGIGSLSTEIGGSCMGSFFSAAV
jgi:hypothetical protein